MVKLEKWSPWGSDFSSASYFQLPHKITRALSLLGFNSSEILCVFAMVSQVRPGSTEISISKTDIARYSGCSSRTANRATRHVVELGATMKDASGVCNVYDLQDFLDCVMLSVSQIPE